MSKVRCRPMLLQPLLLATPVTLVLLADGAAPAYAGCVTVVGQNGIPGLKRGGAGGAANATATTPGNPSNCATATGGAGGPAYDFGGWGGVGGAANSTATTSINSGAASAQATSFGGAGGAGIFGGEGHPPRFGGPGGPASSNATASSTTGSASATATSWGGRPGYGPGGGFGSASADAAASSAGSGQVQADGSALVAGSGGGASASANARNRSGGVVTTAAAPNPNGPTSALTNAAVGPGSPEPLVTIAAGQAVSNAILTPNGPPTPNGPAISFGAMSAAYDGSGLAATYEATAVFDFSTSKGEAVDLYLASDNSVNSAGIAFDSLDLQVVVDGGTPHTYSFSSLTGSGGAEKFFDPDTIDLGVIDSGSQSIEIEYLLGYNSGTSAAPGDGFGFTYALVDPSQRSAAIPEPSTWAMIALGFVGLAFAGYRVCARAGSLKNVT
jgi:hypothetical protein